MIVFPIGRADNKEEVNREEHPVDLPEEGVHQNPVDDRGEDADPEESVH